MGPCGIYIHVGLADNKQMDPWKGIYIKGIQTEEVAIAGEWAEMTQRWGGTCSFKWGGHLWPHSEVDH